MDVNVQKKTNIKIMKNNLQFGISISDKIEDIKGALLAIKNSNFNSIILPGSTIDNKSTQTLESYKQILYGDIDSECPPPHIALVNDLTLPNISREVATQSRNIIDNFLVHFKNNIKILNEFNIQQCSINIAPENDFKNPEKRAQKIALLKRLSPLLIGDNITLLLPVRIPLDDSVDIDDYITFLRDVMSPNIKLSLNIHPHEIRDLEIIAKSISKIRYFLNAVTFIYEPETGNALVKKLILPWLEELEKICYNKPIFLLPRTTSNSVFNKELEKIATLYGSMPNPILRNE